MVTQRDINSLHRKGLIGHPITKGAHLIKGNTHHVYLYVDGTKRPILNPDTFNRF